VSHVNFGRAINNAHWRTLPLISIALLIVLAACGGGGAQTTQSKVGGTLNVGLASDVVTFDPLLSSSLYDRQAMLNVYDTLVKVDSSNKIVPDLATSWVYTTPTQIDFTLRSGVKFQDGTPFNADAVVFNIDRILSTPTSPRASEIAPIKEAVATDASHVRVNLKQPFSPLLATLSDRAGMILSPTAIKKEGTSLANAPVNAGSGPFEFSAWVKGDHLTLKRNPNYWQKDSQGVQLPYLSTITYRPITNETVKYTNLQTGTINVSDTVDANDVQDAKTNSAVVYKQVPALGFYGFELNTKAAPFNDVNARQAIEWGVNRQEIVHNVLKDVGSVAQGPIPPASWAYQKTFAPYSYNIDKAKAALAKTGKTKLSFTLTITSGSPVNQQEAEYIQSELQPVGITVNIKQEPFASLLGDTIANKFQASLLSWSGRPDPDGNMYSYFHTGGGNNNMKYSNAHVDTLLEAARTTDDQQQRATDYQQAQQQIMQDAPYVFINFSESIQATTTNVKNYVLLPTGIMIFTTTYLAS
jgi:peptide/nickel transport system substrate-binding protein